MRKIFNQISRHSILINIFFWLLIIGIFFCINIVNIQYKDLDYKKSITIKVGDEIPSINDYVNSENIEKLDSKEIKWEKINLKDNKIYISGEYSGYINFRGQNLKIQFQVIDDESPKIDGVKDIVVYVNNNVDLLKNIKVTDNSSDEIDLQIRGSYNIKKVGSYSLSYVAKDKSNNETVKEFKLIVKEKEIQKPSTSDSIVVGTTSKGYTIKKVNGVYYINDILIANKTYSLPSSYAPGGLKSIFTTTFNKMKNDASSQGINLWIKSGYRDYYRQRSIYNNYVNRDGKIAADRYSARAGHSEHQSGLAADINSLYTSFINTKEGKWLNDNCYKYGFIIRYPKGKESITGYIYEPWHIRYVGVDLATILYNNGNWISLEEHFGITSQYSY